MTVGRGRARAAFPRFPSLSPWTRRGAPVMQLELTVAAGVVGDAGGPQLREARLTPAAVPAGAFAAQAALVAPARGDTASGCRRCQRPSFLDLRPLAGTVSPTVA